MSFGTKFLRPISTPKEVAQINEKLNQVLHYPIEGLTLMNVSLIKRAEWVAVPAETYTHAIWMNREQLQRIFLERGYHELWAVALDSMGNYPSVYVVPTTVEAIEELNRFWGFFNYALFAGEPDWVIVSTDCEYDVIAGSSDFICQLLDCQEIKEAFSRFHAFVSEYVAMEKQTKEQLYFVHDLLRDEYPEIEVGTELHLLNPSIKTEERLDDDSSFIGQAVLKLTQGDFQGAAEECTEFLKINPDSASTYYLRADAREKLEEYEGAIEDYQKFVELLSKAEDDFMYKKAIHRIKELQQSKASESLNS